MKNYNNYSNGGIQERYLKKLKEYKKNRKQKTKTLK